MVYNKNNMQKEKQGNMLLVGINYNIRTKEQEYVIEELKKDK